VKVKRLFFWLADRQSHSWRKKLDPTAFDLGAGKRVLVKDGKLDTHDRITVPKEMLLGHKSALSQRLRRADPVAGAAFGVPEECFALKSPCSQV
jgi:hypothetical protein